MYIKTIPFLFIFCFSCLKIFPSENSNSFTIIENISTLKASNLTCNNYVKTLGYYSCGDGGDNEFRIVGSTSEEANDGTIIKLNNGLYAVSILDINKINIKHFGAQNNADAHSDIYFEKYVDWCKKKRDYVVKLPPMALSLYKTYVFTPNAAGKNIKIIGEHKVEQRYSSEAKANKSRMNHSGTVIYSHAKEGILFDIQNKSLYAGVTLEGIALYSNNHKTIAVRIISGGQELKIHDLTITNFAKGALYLNNIYDGYITNLTIKKCGMFYDNTSHPALRLYADKTESIYSNNISITNTNALHFTNFHFEHCDRFCSFEKCADIFFVNGKIESMAGEGKDGNMDPIMSHDSFLIFKNESGTISFNSVFFKTPSTARMLQSNTNINLTNLPFFIEFEKGNSGNIFFSNCMFLSYGGGGMPLTCNSDKTYCTISNSIFKNIATGRNAMNAHNLTLTGCTLYFENDGSLYLNNKPCTKAIDKTQKGYPIIIKNRCIISNCRLIFEQSKFSQSTHTNYKTHIFKNEGNNNLIENNLLIVSDTLKEKCYLK